MTNLVWERNSTNADNSDNLKAIAAWWSNLAGKEVVWQQRLIQESVDVTTLDWKPQKFDEKLTFYTPQLRGITIYWRNEKSAPERNITASKLELNQLQQKLYVYPQSQSQVVICISLPEIVYQKIDLTNPQMAATVKGDSYLLLLRDSEQKLEIKLTLDRTKTTQLLNSLQEMPL